MESDEYYVFGYYKVGSEIKREERVYHSKSFEEAAEIARKNGLIEGLLIDHPIGESVECNLHSISKLDLEEIAKRLMIKDRIEGLEPPFNVQYLRKLDN